MADSTPKRPRGPQNPDFTGQHEESPHHNLHSRSLKRQQREANTNPPPKLNLGAEANNQHLASKTLGGQLDDKERRDAKIKKVYKAFAAAMDNLCATFYNDPEESEIMSDLLIGQIKYASTRLHAETGVAVHVPLGLNISQLDSSSSEPETTAPVAINKSTTWADRASVGIVKALKKAGEKAGGSAARKPATSAISGRISLHSLATTGYGSSPTNNNKAKAEKPRIHVSITLKAREIRPQPFPLRKELAKLCGIDIADVPLIEQTKTGWAITPVSFTIRDKLMLPENQQHMSRLFSATEITLPETWTTYAVPSTPATMIDIADGSVINTIDLVRDEVFAQTGRKPVSCKHGKNGVDPIKNTVTYVIAFREKVPAFKLFNASEKSKLIDKARPILRHDPGCQGYCNPKRCIRYTRCSHCGVRHDLHGDEPSGIHCKAKAQCANCQGPFPASHPNCPAAPRRRDGKLVVLSKKELSAVRKLGTLKFKQLHPEPESGSVSPSPTPTPASEAEPMELSPPETPAATAASNSKKRKDAVSRHEDSPSSSTPSRLVPGSKPVGIIKTKAAKPKRPVFVDPDSDQDELSSQQIDE